MKSLLAVAVVAGALVAGCVARVDTIGLKLAERTRFEILWERYGRMPGNKAFALAGDPAGINATGFVYGLSSGEEARAKALDYCEERRIARRIEAPCVVLAIDDDVLAGWLPARPVKGA